MAVSLNLTVGMLGELSLGHAGFMSVGAFSGTLVYVVMSENAPQPLALLLPRGRRRGGGSVRRARRHPRSASVR